LVDKKKTGTGTLRQVKSQWSDNLAQPPTYLTGAME